MSSEPRTASHRKALASLRLKTGEEESRLLAPALSCTGGFCLFRLFVCLAIIGPGFGEGRKL